MLRQQTPHGYPFLGTADPREGVWAQRAPTVVCEASWFARPSGCHHVTSPGILGCLVLRLVTNIAVFLVHVDHAAWHFGKKNLSLELEP